MHLPRDPSRTGPEDACDTDTATVLDLKIYEKSITLQAGVGRGVGAAPVRGTGDRWTASDACTSDPKEKRKAKETRRIFANFPRADGYTN